MQLPQSSQATCARFLGGKLKRAGGGACREEEQNNAIIFWSLFYGISPTHFKLHPITITPGGVVETANRGFGFMFSSFNIKIQL